MSGHRVSLRVCAADGCHEVFESDGHKKFHSNACRQRYYRSHIKAQLKPSDRVLRRCRNCGEIFSCPSWSRREYDSAACKQAFYRQSKNWNTEGEIK